jgi:superfamily II DNA/RNA helicase
MTYLASIFHHLVTEDQADLKLNPTNPLSFRKLKRPRAVILVPSKQLVQQVTEIAKSMSHSARLRVLGMQSKNQSKLTRSEVEDMLKTPIDILICTPGAFAWLSNGSERVRKDKMSEKTKPDIKRGFGVTLSKCKHLVVDECDTLFDTKQVSEAEEIFQPLISRKKEFIKQENNTLVVSTLARPVLNCQFILVSATLPVTLFSYLEKTFPNLKKLTTPSLHRTATTLKQNFIQVHASTTKENILIDILKRSIMNGDKRILVFTNRLNRVDALVFKLAENKFNVFGASSSIDRQKQRPKLEAFMKHASVDVSPQIPLKEYVKGSIEDASDIPFSIEVEQPMICVTTDMFSRGLDTMSCTHVVMFDFPITTIDYIHRAGRTARNGTYGQVTSIVGKKERELATAIEFAYKKKQALTSGSIKK